MKQRNVLNIKTCILQKASKNGGIKKTHLMREVGLSFAQTKSYLDDLERRKYLQVQNNSYVLTDKGRAFLYAYTKLASEEFGELLDYRNINGKIS